MHSCERFYALSFDKVIHVDSEVFKDSLQQLIKNDGITDVLILQNEARYYEDKQLENFITMLAS